MRMAELIFRPQQSKIYHKSIRVTVLIKLRVALNAEAFLPLEVSSAWNSSKSGPSLLVVSVSLIVRKIVFGRSSSEKVCWNEMEKGVHKRKEGEILPSKLVNELNLYLECSICKEMMSDAVVLKNCGHSFCYNCIKAAYKVKKLCPIDRYVTILIRTVQAWNWR